MVWVPLSATGAFTRIVKVNIPVALNPSVTVKVSLYVPADTVFNTVMRAYPAEGDETEIPAADGLDCRENEYVPFPPKAWNRGELKVTP
jgi:hypothetical protein